MWYLGKKYIELLFSQKIIYNFFSFSYHIDIF